MYGVDQIKANVEKTKKLLRLGDKKKEKPKEQPSQSQ